MERLSAEKQATQAKKKLGTAIAHCRGDRMSQRQLALAVGLPPSNMKYIEDGVNAPTRDVYAGLIAALNPGKAERKKLDSLYMSVRRTPPPDVCETLMANPALIEAVRKLDGIKLSGEQAKQVQQLFEHIKNDC